MNTVAEVTGGEALPLDRICDLPEKVRAFEWASRERARAVDRWDKGWVFLALTALLAAEWLIRRRSGLI